MEGLFKTEGEATLRRILLRVVRATSDPPPVISRTTSLAELSPGDRVVAGRLMDEEHRVLVSREADLAPGSDHRFELPHESLLQNWPQLAKWADEARQTLVLAARLRDDSAAWRADPTGIGWMLRSSKKAASRSPPPSSDPSSSRPSGKNLSTRGRTRNPVPSSAPSLPPSTTTRPTALARSKPSSRKAMGSSVFCSPKIFSSHSPTRLGFQSTL